MKNEKQIELKIKVLTHYGNGKCACVKCGFDDIRALSIDHIGGGGREHMRNAKIGNMYLWLWKQNFPDGYQTLCMNCQFIKSSQYDIPNAKGMKSVKLSKRIRAWVDKAEGQFNLTHVRSQLNLTEKESKNVRQYLYLLVKKGIIKHGQYQGSFKKITQSIQVFGE